MASASKQPPTMIDGLKQIVQTIATLQFSPDADIAFLKALETEILVYVHQQLSAGSQAQGGAQQLPQASVPGMTPGGGVAPGGQDQGVPGLMQGAQMPNPDELRRLVGAAGQA